METFELRYFLKVAETQNIHKASELLYISPSAISKAITRLEEELQVKLFERVGRNIKLTSRGLLLKKEAGKLLLLMGDIKTKVQGDASESLITIAGPELLLARMGPKLFKTILNNYPNTQLALKCCSSESAIKMLNNYEADFGLITSNTEPPEIRSKRVKKMAFKTFVSESHPLGKKRKVHIDDLVEHCFAIGNSDWIGEKSYTDSSDGWRDDKFFRKKSIQNLTISCLEGLVDDGLAVTYLPEYYADRKDWRELTVEGCSFSCAQSVFLVTNKEEADPIWSLF